MRILPLPYTQQRVLATTPAFGAQTREPEFVELQQLQTLPPRQLKTILQASARQQPLGHGGSAHVYPLNGFPHLVLRGLVEYPQQSPTIAPSLVLMPIHYPDSMEHNARLGLPLAACVDARDPLVQKQQGLTPLQAYTTPGIHLWVLRKASGQHPHQAYLQDLLKLTAYGRPYDQDGEHQRLYNQLDYFSSTREQGSRQQALKMGRWFLQQCKQGAFTLKKASTACFGMSITAQRKPKDTTKPTNGLPKVTWAPLKKLRICPKQRLIRPCKHYKPWRAIKLGYVLIFST